ncbi:MAG: flavodoxin family protein, partial [Methanomicrobiales archaeon]|nr:flavodoxin family protein [Methanomicrobiales archaeon]
EGFFSSHPLPPPRVAHYTATDVVVIQGSPRGEGNSSIFAGWAADAARNTEKSSQVLYPNDMDIHHCIGCYQCYNTGYCIYDDDMGTIIAALNDASLVVVCSPVYTMTVPSGLKALIDRCQAYHAQRLLASDESTRKGLLLSVAGRKGMSNFSCLQGTIHAYMRNLGMKPEEDILIDGMDEVRDVRNVAGVKERVEAAVTGAISGKSGLP